ncbi:hypothetical protein HDU78_008416 [Chytriomyces hyalinus]|nr:hypothetical protein HDU78_008416 [Chytriomyces hyalinus]
MFTGSAAAAAPERDPASSSEADRAAKRLRMWTSAIDDPEYDSDDSASDPENDQYNAQDQEYKQEPAALLSNSQEHDQESLQEHDHNHRDHQKREFVSRRRTLNSEHHLADGTPRKRIVRACDPCRRKRAKCSGETPCALCGLKPHLCVYAPVVKKGRKRERPLISATVAGPSTGPSTAAPESPLPPSASPSNPPQDPSLAPIPGMMAAVPSPLQTVSDSLPFSSMEMRLQAVERVLNQLVPNCLDDPSKVQSMPVQPNFGSQSNDDDLASAWPTHPHDPARVDNPNAGQSQVSQVAAKPTFKTGGFLTNSEETALTFWGSTSALGGTNNKAHLYKSIPRFVNGVLLVHIGSNSNYVETTEFRKWVDPAPKPSAYVDPPSSQCEVESKVSKLSAKEPSQSQCLGTGATSRSLLFLLEDTKEFSQIIPLPDELLDHILKHYWNQFHPQFPVIEKEWFNTQLAHLRSIPSINIEEHWQFVLVLTSVVALMINFTPSLTHWKKPSSASPQLPTPVTSEASAFTDHDVVLKHLVDSYKKIIFEHFEFPNVYVVQSLLIMVLTGGCGRGARISGIWGYMGMAVRMSQELGLHRSIAELGVKHRRFNRETMALRNRTWHCVMIMETYTCIWTGRPMAIHDNDWDAEDPAVTSPETATLKHHIELAKIIASILRFANRARAVNVEEFIRDTTARLEGWWARLDDDWRALVFKERWNSKALMALMYHGAVILFHRMAHNRIDQPVCLASAAAITVLVSRFEKPPDENECIALFPTFTYCAMLACTVHFGQMLGHSNTSDSVERLVKAVGNLEKCMRVFDTLRSVFVDAERCWKTILDFLAVKGIRLDELVVAAKSGSAVADAIAGMSDLASVSGGSPSMILAAEGKVSDGSERAADKLVASSKAGKKAASNTQLGSYGFIQEALARNEMIQNVNPALQQQPMSGNRSAGSRAHMGLLGTNGNESSTSSSSPSANIGILGGGDLGFMWDGLSLFDLAGLGGLGTGDFGLSQPQTSQFPQRPQQIQQPPSFNSFHLQNHQVANNQLLQAPFQTTSPVAPSFPTPQRPQAMLSTSHPASHQMMQAQNRAVNPIQANSAMQATFQPQPQWRAHQQPQQQQQQQPQQFIPMIQHQQQQHNMPAGGTIPHKLLTPAASVYAPKQPGPRINNSGQLMGNAGEGRSMDWGETYRVVYPDGQGGPNPYNG